MFDVITVGTFSSTAHPPFQHLTPRTYVYHSWRASDVFPSSKHETACSNVTNCLGRGVVSSAGRQWGQYEMLLIVSCDWPWA